MNSEPKADNHWLLYGAYGYSGKLIAEEAVRRGLKPTLAGRDEKRLQPLAERLALPHVAFPLSDAAKTVERVRGMRLVLNCAGPYKYTMQPMLDACLKAGAHYLDITGEIDPLEHAYSRHEDAVKANCVVMPGVGFDVAATDCMALKLSERMPNAERLILAFAGVIEQSPGTWKTTIEVAPSGGRIRQEGRIQSVPHAWKTFKIEREGRRRSFMSIPWGDVASAYRTTGIPNIETYIGASGSIVFLFRAMRSTARLLALKPFRAASNRLVDWFIRGPGEKARSSRSTYLYGKVSTDLGDEIEDSYVLPEPYRFTALSAVESVHRILSGDYPPGAWTPSRLFGSGYAEEIAQSA